MNDKLGYQLKPVKCNICKVDDAVFVGDRISLFTKERLSAEIDSIPSVKVVKCKRCSLIYPNPMAIPTDAQLQKNYGEPDQYFPDQSCSGNLGFYKKLIDELSCLKKEKGRFLDVGCGRGKLVYAAGINGWQAEGIDTSHSFIDYARKQFDINVKAAKLENMNYPDESFDAICLASVLQHVQEPYELMMEINRILKKDGILYMQNINNAALIYKLGDFYHRLSGRKITTCLSPLNPSYQIYGFSPKSTREICRRTNFKIIKIAIRGIRGGGSLTSSSLLKGAALELFRKAIIMLGGLTGQGHILEVYAKKIK